MARTQGALAWKTLAKMTDDAIITYLINERAMTARHAANYLAKLRERHPHENGHQPPPAPAPVPAQEPTQEAVAEIIAEEAALKAPQAAHKPVLADFGPETDAGRELAKMVGPSLMPVLAAEIARQTGAIRPTQINIAGRAPVVINERTHPIFHKVMRLVNQGANVMLVGPAGCGKTTLGHQIAKALARPFTTFSCSAGASEAQLLGRLLPVGEGGKFEYVESPFVKAYREGGVILIDEMDAADANLLLVLNTALANGGMYVEARAASGLEVYVQRHPDTVILAAANTFGHGADAQYVGRAPLDAATLDRYYRVQMDYDRDLEDDMGRAEIVQWVRDLRQKAQAARLRRVVSSRAILRMEAAMKGGLSLAEAKADEMAAWTADEKAKVGAA